VHEPVDPQIAIGRSPAKVGVERVADEVVGVQPIAATNDERTRLEPGPDLGRGVADGSPKQILARQPGVREDGQTRRVRLARHLADHLGDEGPDEVGSIGELLGDSSARPCGVGEERERQRMPPTQRREANTDRPRHAGSLQQVDALGGVQRIDRLNCSHRPPSRIRPPWRRRRVTAGEHHDHRGVERG
jgi:hypothetical protein